jgi:hypothetical protein
MREFLTTGDLGLATGYTTQQIRNLWNNGLIPAELLNPGGKQLRFKKTKKILDWCAERAKEADERAARRRARQSRHWTKDHEALLRRLVTKERPTPHCDLTAWRMWRELCVANRLTVRELQESIRAGKVTRIKIDPERDRGVGFASFESWSLQWKLLRRQIEDTWRGWSDKQAMEALDFVKPVESFAWELRKKFGIGS